MIDIYSKFTCLRSNIMPSLRFFVSKFRCATL